MPLLGGSRRQLHGMTAVLLESYIGFPACRSKHGQDSVEFCQILPFPGIDYQTGSLRRHILSATFLIPKRVQDTPKRSVVPASQPVAMARGPLDQPLRFALTWAPQSLLRHRS